MLCEARVRLRFVGYNSIQNYWLISHCFEIHEWIHVSKTIGLIPTIPRSICQSFSENDTVELCPSITMQSNLSFFITQHHVTNMSTTCNYHATIYITTQMVWPKWEPPTISANHSTREKLWGLVFLEVCEVYLSITDGLPWSRLMGHVREPSFSHCARNGEWNEIWTSK